MYDPLVVDTFATCWPKLVKLEIHSGELEGDRAAVALEGRRALRAGESLTSREVPDSIDRTLNQVLEKTGADLAILFATDREHDSIFSTVVVSRRDGRTNDSVRMPLGYGVSGWVAVNSSTVTNADPVLDWRQLASKYSLVRIICVPVRQKAETVGVLSLYSSDLRGFSDADRSFTEEAVAALDSESGIGVFQALTRDVILSELPPLPTIH
jgi:GAF domain-containing protein